MGDPLTRHWRRANFGTSGRKSERRPTCCAISLFVAARQFLLRAFVFVRRPDRPRPGRWRCLIGWPAKRWWVLRVIQTYPTSALADHGRSLARLLRASTLVVEHVECRQADLRDLFFIHHLLGDRCRCSRIRIHAANCGGRAGNQRE